MKPGKRKQSKGSSLMAELLESLPGLSCRKREVVLAKLQELCKDEDAAKMALSHALTVPLLTQHMLGNSPACTAMAVDLLWQLCWCSSDGLVMVEALQFGAFQKLMVIAQICVCGDTKRKVCQLLKLFHHFRDSYECVDSSDFRHIRRSY